MTAHADHTAFLVTEPAPGRPLPDVIDDEPGMPTVTRLSIVCQAAEGLQAAHDAGVIHGDLTPERVLVAEDGVVSVTGFGTAGALTPGPSSAYTAPERARGGEVSDAADVYALGAVAYELLAGRRPFVRHATLPFTPAADAVPPLPDSVPRHAAAIIEAALSRDPLRRPASAGDVARVLRREMAAMGGSPPVRPVPAAVGGAVDAGAATQPVPAIEPDDRPRARSLGVVGTLAGLLLVGAIVGVTARSRSGDTVRSETPAPPTLTAVTSTAAPLAPLPQTGTPATTQAVITGPAATRAASAPPSVASPSVAPSVAASPGAAPPAGAVPTTAASTTAASTTAAPTTASPTTVPRTTVPTTTGSPTTARTTTVAPTTERPTTTVAPTTVAPTTAATTTAAPTTAATTVPPTTSPTTSAAPLTLPPLTLPPITLPPLTDDAAIAFVADYYGRVAAGDYRTTWASLSDEFRDGRDLTYSRYVSFWEQHTVELGEMRVVAGPGVGESRVVFDARYSTASGVVTETDEITLRRAADGSPVIAAQRTV